MWVNFYWEYLFNHQSQHGHGNATIITIITIIVLLSLILIGGFGTAVKSCLVLDANAWVEISLEREERTHDAHTIHGNGINGIVDGGSVAHSLCPN